MKMVSDVSERHHASVLRVKQSEKIAGHCGGSTPLRNVSNHQLTQRDIKEDLNLYEVFLVTFFMFFVPASYVT
jgi:hypothetical protein